jgi:hypothetical protein
MLRLTQTRPRSRILPYATRGMKKLMHFIAALPWPDSDLSCKYVHVLPYD